MPLGHWFCLGVCNKTIGEFLDLLVGTKIELKANLITPEQVELPLRASLIEELLESEPLSVFDFHKYHCINTLSQQHEPTCHK